MKNGTAAARKFFVFRFEDVEVREREFRVVKAGEVLAVEPKAFSLLLFLLRNPERLISKDELLNTVWKDAEVTEHSLTQTIAKLRRLLSDDFHEPRYIATVPKVGYRLVCKVEVIEDRADEVDPVAVPHELDGSPTMQREEPAQEATFEPQPAGSARESAETGRTRPIKPRWLIAGLATAAGAVFLGWYLHRPAEALRVSEYRQITHDGRRKGLFGSDGVRLYLNFYPDTQPIGQVAATGGEIVRVPLDIPTPWVVDVSPDGSTLLVIALNDKDSLWSVEAVGSSKRRLVDSGVDTAAWSPDGNSIAYLLDRVGDVYAMRADGSGRRRLATIPRVSGNALMARIAWSPDGKAIRFDRNNRIWEVSPDGTGLHEFLPQLRPSAWRCCGAWTPDGRRFLFLEWQVPGASYLNFPPSQIWALDERRGLTWGGPTEPVQLTSGPIRWGRPFSGADGRKIYDRGVTLNGELVRWNARTQDLQPFLGGASEEFVAFSPDGKHVAYVTFPEGVLWRADRDGSHPLQLTDPPLYPLTPRWSPDGKQILFLADDAAGKTKSYLVSAQGGSAHVIPEGGDGEQSAGSWSPSGDKAVFEWTAPGGHEDLRLVDLSSRAVTEIPGSSDKGEPAWSPDGRSVAAITRDTQTLTVFDFKTQKWTTLDNGRGGHEFPTWSHDGRFLYFLQASGEPGVFRIRREGGPAERVVDLKGFRFTSSVTTWMGLDPDDAPILLRDAGADDIYALSLDQK